MNLKLFATYWLTFVMFATTSIHASVTEFTNKADWQSAVRAYTTIGFAEYPHNTIITDQYIAQGVLFTDGIDLVTFNPSAFPIDHYGLRGAIDSITTEFLQPQYSIAVHHPGLVQFELYWEGQLTYTSSLFTLGTSFSGLISTMAFDEARIFDPTGGVNIDDLHFGPPIPAPAGIALLGAATMVLPKRRRKIPA